MQVYVDKAAIDESLVRRMSAVAGHPHAADAFLSMMLSPRGGAGLGKMAAAVSARGTPICLMHGAPHLVPAGSGERHGSCAVMGPRSVAATTPRATAPCMK